MKSAFYLLVLCFCSTQSTKAQNIIEIQNFSIGATSNNKFTSNNFKAIAVGKGGLIWAGTQYEGLYIYSPKYNIWTKSDSLANVFINDIKADPDSGIWIAQSGVQAQGNNGSNIAGGVNHFRLATDQVMEFYSVVGTTTGAYLTSRNAKGLYLDPNYKEARGKLPRPWVALGVWKSSSSGNPLRGGVNVGLNAAQPYFDNINYGFAILGSPTHWGLSVAGNNEEVWVATRFNQGSSTLNRYLPNKQFIGYITPANTPEFPVGFEAQAMLFDTHGNKWVGLKNGGLRILSNKIWYTMNSNFFFPPGTQVNFNAMVEDEYGNVFIGTSNGLLKFKNPDNAALAAPDNFSAYEHYTTTNGLLNDNITGLAYDKKNHKVLITSSGGVTFMKISPPHISGAVFNVRTAIDSTNNPYAGLQKEPFRTTQDVRAYLLKDGVEKEMVYPDADGLFELKEANETDTYTVEVKYTSNGKMMKFIYNDIKNHTFLKTTQIPDSLIGEIKDMVGKLEKRCFPVKLYFNSEFKELFCTDKLAGGNAFNTSGYESPYEAFFNPSGISSDYDKRINNLANYYASLASVYKIGGQATDLVIDGTSGLLDLLEALVGAVKFKIAMDKPGNKETAEALDEQVIDGLKSLAGAIKEGANFILNKGIKYFITDPQIKKVAENCVSALTEVADLVLATLSDGAASGTLMKALVDNAKKLIAAETALRYYKNFYAQDRHQNFVSTLSSNATALKSDLTYIEAYDQLYSPTQNSLGKRATDDFNDYKTIISVLGDIAKMSDVAAGLANAATILVVIPGGQAIAVAAKQLSLLFQGAKIGAVGGASITGFIGASGVAKKSDSILVNANLQRGQINTNSAYNNSGLIARLATDSLIARKDRYNLRLTEIQDIYSAGSFNAATYKIKRKQIKFEDSLFTQEIKVAVNSLISISNSATNFVPFFKVRMDKVLDTFVAEQITQKQAYFFDNLAFIYETDKTKYVAGIDSTINTLKILNDSLVNSLSSLLTDVNNSPIEAQGFLMQENYSIVFSRIPGSNGTVTYSFKNYGAAPVNNVSFKLKDLTAGYTLISADSLNVGNILPGQTKQITYTFKSPTNDSIGNYKIEIKANNGQYNDVYGLFYATDPSTCYTQQNGNWNDPATWTCGVVPGINNKVVIGHEVLVTVNAVCKDVRLLDESKLTVEPGKNLNIIP